MVPAFDVGEWWRSPVDFSYESCATAVAASLSRRGRLVQRNHVVDATLPAHLPPRAERIHLSTFWAQRTKASLVG
jgi:hypothetical protein